MDDTQDEILSSGLSHADFEAVSSLTTALSTSLFWFYRNTSYVDIENKN